MLLNITSYPRSGSAMFMLACASFGHIWRINGRKMKVKMPLQHMGIDVNWKGMPDYPRDMFFNLAGVNLLKAAPDYHKDENTLYIIRFHETAAEIQTGFVVHLVRDGRDAICSYADYIEQTKLTPRKANLQALSTGGPDCKFSFWPSYERQWIDRQSTDIIARFEDIIPDPPGNIASILGDLRMEVSPVFKPMTFEKCQKIRGWYFKSGKHGRYKTDLPNELRIVFEEKARAVLNHYGYE